MRCQGARQGDPLLFTAGKFGHGALLEPLQINDL